MRTGSEVEPAIEDIGRASNRVEALDRGHRSERQNSGLGGQEPDRDRAHEARCDELVGHFSAERLRDRELEQIDAGAQADEVRHLAGRDPGGHFNDEHTVVRDDELRKRDPVPQSQPAHGGERELARLIEDRRWKPRRKGMDPADPEAEAARPQPVRDRQQARLAAAHDQEDVQLLPVDERLEHRGAAPRERERLLQVADRVCLRLDHEEAALAAGVDRLDHCGQTHLGQGSLQVSVVGHDAVCGLPDPALREASPHLRLIGHPARDRDADPGESECIRDRGGGDDAPVGADRERTFDAERPCQLDHPSDVGEIDRLRNVRERERDGVRVSVDCDDPMPGKPRMPDRRKLRHTGPQKQQRGHASSRGRRRAPATGAVACRRRRPTRGH